MVTSSHSKVPRGLPDKAVKFAIFGDLAVKEQEGANWTLYRLKQHLADPDSGFDAILHVGDIVRTQSVSWLCIIFPIAVNNGRCTC